MGILDKLKAAAAVVTGGAAEVTLEYEPKVVMPGDTIRVKVTAASAGAEVKSGGVFVDLRAEEQIRVPRSAVAMQTKDSVLSMGDIHVEKTSFEQSFPIAPALVLAPNETKQFEGTVQVPAGVEPSYRGPHSEHRWQIRGRLDAFGNDPDSGWQPVRIGVKI